MLLLPFLSWRVPLPDRKVRLGQLARAPGDAVRYVYDSGSMWAHTITVEAVEDSDAAAAAAGGGGGAPLSGVALLGGGGGCPPEDCGGPVWG